MKIKLNIVLNILFNITLFLKTMIVFLVKINLKKSIFALSLNKTIYFGIYSLFIFNLIIIGFVSLGSYEFLDEWRWSINFFYHNLSFYIVEYVQIIAILYKFTQIQCRWQLLAFNKFLIKMWNFIIFNFNTINFRYVTTQRKNYINIHNY